MTRSHFCATVVLWLAASCLGGCRSCGDPSGPAKSTARARRPAQPAAPASAGNAIQPMCGGAPQPFPTGPTIVVGGAPKTLSRTTRWAPGIPGGIPARTTICKTLSPSGGDSDGSAITNAIKDCPDNQVVKLEPGTYRIKDAIFWKKSNVVLRGSGGPGASPATQTRLMAEAALFGPVVNIGPDLFPHAAGPSSAFTEDGLQGTDSIAVASAQRFKVGDLVVVDMTGDPKNDRPGWVLDAPSGGTELAYPFNEFHPKSSPPGSDSRGWFIRKNRPVAQIMEIAKIEGNRIHFSTPFHLTFDRAHAAEVTQFLYMGEQSAPIANAGLEDLYVGGLPPPGKNSQQNNITLNLAKYSWIKNVESDNSNGNSIGIDSSFRCIVRDSYLHSTINPNPGGAGYGLEFSQGSADNLAENNISWNFNKIMVMRASGGGNVLAYNYMDDGYIQYQPNFVESGLNASHMTHSHFELFEGNLSFALGSESTWGNASFITWVRNLGTSHRAGWPPLNKYTFNAKANSPGGCTTSKPDDRNCIPYTDLGLRTAGLLGYGHVFYNFIGNVLGYRGMPTAPQKEGFAYESVGPKWPSDPVPLWLVGYDIHEDGTDEGVFNTLFRDGNYDFATKKTEWSAGPHALPTSLYLCDKPKFFGSYAWPWVDGSNAATPYVEHTYRYHPRSPTLGTFESSGDLVPYSGFQLPAFVRFLQLRGIEAVEPGCKAVKASEAPPQCRLLLTGFAP
jgi:hypothetical protein